MRRNAEKAGRREVAAVASLAVAAVLTAIFLVRNGHERAEDLKQSPAQHADLIRGIDRLERTLAEGLSRGPGVHVEGLQEAGIDPPAKRIDLSQPVPAVVEMSAAQRIQHEESIKAGSSIVDRAIQSGQWTRDDQFAFEAAAHSLSGEERSDLMARLSVAINSDQVRWNAQ